MDAFNEKYKKRVERWPYQAEAILGPNDTVDPQVWDVTRVAAASGRGNIILQTLEAEFTGPQHTSNGTRRYLCRIEAVDIRWEQEPGGEPPTVEPGQPRPPDWHPAGPDARTNVVNTHRSWVENLRGRIDARRGGLITRGGR